MAAEASDQKSRARIDADSSLLVTAENAKDCAKHAKIKHWYYVLCELCVKPLRPLRLMDFDFFNSPNKGGEYIV